MVFPGFNWGNAEGLSNNEKSLYSYKFTRNNLVISRYFCILVLPERCHELHPKFPTENFILIRN